MVAWTLRWGTVIDQLIEKASEPGPEPAALIEQPELPVHLETVAELFWLLSNQRPFAGGGMGPPMPRPIPVQDIWTTAPDWGLDPGYFLRVTGRADALYIDHLNRIAETRMKQSRGKKRHG